MRWQTDNRVRERESESERKNREREVLTKKEETKKRGSNNRAKQVAGRNNISVL